MAPSAKIAEGRVGKLSREQALSALREYAELYGPDFGSAAFNSANARWAGREDLVEKYYAGRPDGRPWPSLNSIKAATGGSFTAAREAAGLPKNRPGPRRRVGEAAPIRDTRVQRVMVESDRDRELMAKLDRARARAERAERLLAEARAKPREVVRERVVRERVPVTTTVTKTKVVEKKVKVTDVAKLERLRGKLADAEARARAAEDQTKSAIRDRDDARRLADVRARELTTLTDDSRSAAADANRLRDALTASEARVDRLRSELVEAQAVDGDARERAVASDLVAKAEARAEHAEVRAARAEREMAEQGAAVVGELRKLTRAELDELRAKGPAGPVVLAGALKKLGMARKLGGSDLDAALLLVARAALAWRERLP